MDYNIIKKCLMKYSVEQKDWDIVYILYKLFYIGIPNIYIYKFPQKNIFTLSEVLDSKNEVQITSRDIKLNKLLLLFKTSKWSKLEEFDGMWGYRYKL